MRGTSHNHDFKKAEEVIRQFPENEHRQAILFALRLAQIYNPEGQCATCASPYLYSCSCRFCPNQSPHVTLEDRKKYNYPELKVEKQI